jgi:hypothetical protein
VRVFRRLVALTGVVGLLSIGVAITTATAVAAGSVGCEGGGSPGSTPVSADHGNLLGAASFFASISGTTETDIFIDAFEERVSVAGSGASSGSIAFVEIAIFDTETGGQSIDAFGCVTNPDFQIDQTLTSATLGPTLLTVVDSNTSTSTTATVSADWTGIGDTTRTTQTSHFHSGHFTNIFNLGGFDRFADATGTVADPGLNVNLDGAAIQASLDKVNDFFIFICVGGC